MRGVFVTGTGTGVGKTFVARGLCRALVNRGTRVAAIKPLETGWADGATSDARALDAAAKRSDLAHAAGLYRARAALAPYAATLSGEAPPSMSAIVERVRALAGDDYAVIEGAGGLLVPLDAQASFADLAGQLGLPSVLVAVDALGTLSHTLTAYTCARAAELEVRAIVLTRRPPSDGSAATNARILAERCACPVLVFRAADDDDDDLSRACEESGLLEFV